MKRKHIAVALIPILFVLLCVALVLLITETASFRLNGYGVDSSGKLYVGRAHEIHVFEDGREISTIRIPRYRTWGFTVLADDRIALSDSTTIYIMDLSGEILETKEDSKSVEYRKWSNQKEFTGSDGQVYKLKRIWGRSRIIDSANREVYESPVLDSIATVSFFVSVIGGIAVILFVASRIKSAKE